MGPPWDRRGTAVGPPRDRRKETDMKALYKVGQKVEVESDGAWHTATITEVGGEPLPCPLHCPPCGVPRLYWAKRDDCPKATPHYEDQISPPAPLHLYDF